MELLFTYGTLKPGRARWAVLAPYADPAHPLLPATVDGRLWYTPHGWPAATPGAGNVPGVLVPLRPDLRNRALAVLDAVEGEGFERGLARTGNGVECWIYWWRGAMAHLRERHAPW